MTIHGTRDFPQTIDCFLEWSDDQGATIDPGTFKSSGDAQSSEMALLFQHIERIDEHEARKQRFCPGEQHATAKLSKGVVLSIRCYNVMRGLWPSVITYDGMGWELAREEIGDGTFASIAKSQVRDKNRLFLLMHKMSFSLY